MTRSHWAVDRARDLIYAWIGYDNTNSPVAEQTVPGIGTPMSGAIAGRVDRAAHDPKVPGAAP
jgi:hypothetical protein